MAIHSSELLCAPRIAAASANIENVNLFCRYIGPLIGQSESTEEIKTQKVG